MPDISQIMAASYPAVANEANKAENQYRGHAFLDFLNKLGGVRTIPWGTKLELTLDYQRNPGAQFIATDLTATSLAKTEILTAAEYAEGQIVVPVTWTFADEAKNPTTNQKVNFVAELLESANESHDDLLEQTLFGTTTQGFLGLQSLLPDSGQGSPGGINAALDTWWRHGTYNYYDDGSDIVAKLTYALKVAAKGSGGAEPNLIVAGVDPHNLYEGALQPQIRFKRSEVGDGMFVALQVGKSDFVFSQYGPEDHIYGIHTKNTKVYFAKGGKRKMGKEIEITNQTAMTKKMWSMLQLATNNKSRNFVLVETAAPQA